MSQTSYYTSLCLPVCLCKRGVLKAHKGSLWGFKERMHLEMQGPSRSAAAQIPSSASGSSATAQLGSPWDPGQGLARPSHHLRPQIGAPEKQLKPLGASGLRGSLSSEVPSEGAQGVAVWFPFGLRKGPEGGSGHSPGRASAPCQGTPLPTSSAPSSAPQDTGGTRKLGSLHSCLFVLGTFSKHSLSTYRVLVGRWKHHLWAL